MQPSQWFWQLTERLTTICVRVKIGQRQTSQVSEYVHVLEGKRGSLQAQGVEGGQRQQGAYVKAAANGTACPITGPKVHMPQVWQQVQERGEADVGAQTLYA